MSDWLHSSWLFLLLRLLLLPLLEDLPPLPPFFGARASRGNERLRTAASAASAPASEFEVESEGRAEMVKSKGWRMMRRVGSVKCIVWQSVLEYEMRMK